MSLSCPQCKRIMSSRKHAVGILNNQRQTVYNYTCYNKECPVTDVHVFADEHNKRGKKKFRTGHHPQTGLVHPAYERPRSFSDKALRRATGQDIIDDMFRDYGDR